MKIKKLGQSGGAPGHLPAKVFLALVHTKATLENWCLSAGLGMPHVPLNELARESETWATLLQLLPLQTKLSDRKMET